ncbi:hypothetical protein B0A55_09627 [Friedmanniomyces simplex]|uniref:Ribosomal RNA-processing protein 1 n=1 Tax=Friedmanniomyces simplex TaxID=329884 RepID=A0A4U0WU16_9PEZI|nr:hypothetical protein B0A55_09627 [Friedmanniomyces simplex]
MAHQSNPFIKQLASSDRKLRTSALASLRQYLSSHHSAPLSQLDLLKLWKALFYCLYMQDKPLHQQRLAQDLADLTDVLLLKSGKNTEEDGGMLLGWFEAFWLTMAREWSGIDGLRMDKYLYLVRCYIRKGFEVCAAQQGWGSEGFLDSYLGVLRRGPLSPRDAKVPDGLRYHVLDIYVDELEKADAQHAAPIEVVLEPVRLLGRETVSKAVRKRVKEALEDERLREREGMEGMGVDGKGEATAGVENGSRGEAAATESGGMGADVDDDNDEFGGFDD